MKMQYVNQSVLVIGFGVSGQSAAAFLLRQGAKVWVHDDQLTEEKVRAIQNSDLHLFEDFRDDFAFVVVSPGISKTHCLYNKAIEAGIEVIGEAELAFRSLHYPVIAVTGTNGKTTTTLLIAHILQHCHQNAIVLGNGGVPLTSEFNSGQSIDVIIVELSSFQLETMRSPCLDGAAVLNITPDHLDRYRDIDEYAATKLQIGRYLKNEGVFYVEEKAWKKYGHYSRERSAKTYGYNATCSLYAKNGFFYEEDHQGLKVPKEYPHSGHDLENMMAAYALCSKRGVSFEQFFEAVKSFTKPPHRIEYVRQIDGVDYYNDSKGTNIDAVMRCVESLHGDIILIAGGVDKGESYSHWLEPFKGKVRAVFAIGEAAQKIKQELQLQYPAELCKTLEEAVQKASQHAKRGEKVLLSPGCSSFDMFLNYAHRGEEFKRLVHKLEKSS